MGDRRGGRALCALAAWRRWRFLDGSPYPMGVDGYYYAVQLRSLLGHGHLVWPAAPLAFWLMAPAAALAGPIAGAKLGAAVLGAPRRRAGVPARAPARRRARARPGSRRPWSPPAAGSFYLSVEFVKQGVGVTVALAALVVLARALERPTRGRIAAAAAGRDRRRADPQGRAGLVAWSGCRRRRSSSAPAGRLAGRRLIRVGLAGAAVVALAGVAGALWPSGFVASATWPSAAVCSGPTPGGRRRPSTSAAATS